MATALGPPGCEHADDKMPCPNFLQNTIYDMKSMKMKGKETIMMIAYFADRVAPNLLDVHAHDNKVNLSAIAGCLQLSRKERNKGKMM